MEFKGKIRPKWQITIPSKQGELNGFSVGDVVVVSVIKADSIEDHKRNLERPYR